MTEVAADFATQAMAVDEREKPARFWEQTLVAPDARKSILVLDEEDGFRRFLVAALTGVGYSVVDTSNSNQAITLLNGDVAFDLLIADVKMPSRTGTLDALC
jgi:PleD family two-component response regulator